jgi:hypothetical protein
MGNKIKEKCEARKGIGGRVSLSLNGSTLRDY